MPFPLAARERQGPRAGAPARRFAGLERDVVVHVVEAGGRLRRLASRRARRRGTARFAMLVGTRAAHPFAAAEHLHLLGDDLGGVVVLAFLVLPLARLQAALDVHRAPFLEVLTSDLGQSVVEDDAMPLGFLLLLAAVAVLPVAGGGDADVADRCAAGRVAHLGVAAEVADDDDLVDRCHGASWCGGHARALTRWRS